MGAGVKLVLPRLSRAGNLRRVIISLHKYQMHFHFSLHFSPFQRSPSFFSFFSDRPVKGSRWRPQDSTGSAAFLLVRKHVPGLLSRPGCAPSRRRSPLMLSLYGPDAVPLVEGERKPSLSLFRLAGDYSIKPRHHAIPDNCVVRLHVGDFQAWMKPIGG